MGLLASVVNSETGDYSETVQTVESHYGENKYCDQFAPSGEDCPPLKEDIVALIDIEGTGNMVSVGVMSKSQGAKPGEKLIYSRDKDGNVVAKIYLKNDGSVEFEGNGDAELTISGGVTINVKSDCTVNVDGNATLESKGNVLIKGAVKVEGNTCEIGGTVAPTGSGAFCALPYCTFSGAPQSGKISSGN